MTIGKELDGIAGTNVSYVSRKVKESLDRERDLRELYEKAEKNLFSEG